MSYDVEYTRDALRQFASLPVDMQEKVAKKLARLAEEPTKAANVKALKGEEGYRLRVGDYRVVYYLEHKKLLVVVVRVAHRREVYR